MIKILMENVLNVDILHYTANIYVNVCAVNVVKIIKINKLHFLRKSIDFM